MLALLTVALALLGVSASSAFAVDYEGTHIDMGFIAVGETVSHDFTVTPSEGVFVLGEDTDIDGGHVTVDGGPHGPGSPIPVHVTVTGAGSPTFHSEFINVAVFDATTDDVADFALNVFWEVTDDPTPTPTPSPTPTSTPTPTPTPAGTALLKISPGTVDFGTVWLGDAPTKTVTIKNIGTADSDDLIVRSFGPDSSDVEPLYARYNALGPGDSVVVPITWAPETRGPLDASIGIETLGGIPEGSVALKGTAKAPVVKLSTTALKFGTVGKGKSVSKTITVKNGGEGTIMFARFPKITGSGASSFSWKGSTKGIKPGKSTTFTVTFKPTAKGSRSATLRFSPGSGPVALTGTGK